MESPLSTRQRVNIGLVSVLSQAILITIVAVLLRLFFTLFGVLASLHFGGRTLVLTEALLRVSGFLGAFAACISPSC